MKHPRNAVVGLLGLVFALPAAGLLLGGTLREAMRHAGDAAQAMPLTQADRALFMASQGTRSMPAPLGTALLRLPDRGAGSLNMSTF